MEKYDYEERQREKISCKDIPATESRKKEDFKFIGCFDVAFSEPDQYNQIHSSIKLPLSLDEKVVYMDLKINGGEPIRFHFYYSDAGTVGYAAMRGHYAIGGKLSNVSMNWAKPKESDIFRIINAIGRLENGQATLHLWMTKKTLK